ncbi:hypothetical protein GCM10011346_02920 [Oceanobacillus neutriphilus]|uniref:YhfH-like protein n=1 Tax=Oceanobacillus neutriphilus TaxID=531815 RepID=A0ABQ2NPE0_9BACI|nr:hypothetical protein GCM10011346_02920 [Oceanobacillus neutriphilus]
MSDTVDLMLEGNICQCCGDLIDGDDPGYPRDCDSCGDNR